MTPTESDVGAAEVVKGSVLRFLGWASCGQGRDADGSPRQDGWTDRWTGSCQDGQAPVEMDREPLGWTERWTGSGQDGQGAAGMDRELLG